MTTMDLSNAVKALHKLAPTPELKSRIMPAYDYSLFPCSREMAIDILMACVDDFPKEMWQQVEDILKSVR